MYLQEAKEEYARALKSGIKEHKQALAENRSAHPLVLDQIVDNPAVDIVQEIGIVEIPVERIVGIKSAGRITAFSPSFLPLLDERSEFAYKWASLCRAHLSEGIRDPILCYEYLGDFYVQEGNKRVSVLRHMGATRITAQVKRVLPAKTEEPRVQAYFEFLEFYRDAGLYQIQFHRPGDYALFLSYLGKELGQKWEEREVRTVSAYYQYFLDAFRGLGGERLGLIPEEALLVWLEVYPFRQLGELTDKQLRKTITSIWEELEAQTMEEPVDVSTEPVETEEKTNVLTRIITGAPEHLQVAFAHPLNPQDSPWIQGHDLGRQYLEEVLGDRITTYTYFPENEHEDVDSLLEQAVEDGADVVFTTTPQMSRNTLRIAVKYPKVRFLNCSVDTPYPSIRTYYSRIYEAKFITGAIAGAMADDDWIGYVGSNPILGVPASINAFALGAQLTNPRAKVVLKWSCMAGNPQEEFLSSGIRVISNRDVPTQERKHLDFCNYGTYAMNDDGQLQALASPVWLWGKFYENVVRSIFAGTWDKNHESGKAVNYWWGFDSGVIDVELAEHIPEGIRVLAQALRKGIQNGEIAPFYRRLVAQNGQEMNDGSRDLTTDEILHMDWLCDNVIGAIPEFDEIEPYAQAMVRRLGVYRDRIPVEMEGSL